MFYQLLLKLSSLSLCLCHDKCHWVCVCKRVECVCAQTAVADICFIRHLCVEVCVRVANTNAKGFLSNKNKAASGFHMFLWTLVLPYTLIYSSIYIGGMRHKHWHSYTGDILSQRAAALGEQIIFAILKMSTTADYHQMTYKHTMEYIHTISLLTAPAAWHCWAPGA